MAGESLPLPGREPISSTRAFRREGNITPTKSLGKHQRHGQEETMMEMTKQFMNENKAFLALWALLMAYCPVFVGVALLFGK